MDGTTPHQVDKLTFQWLPLSDLTNYPAIRGGLVAAGAEDEIDEIVKSDVALVPTLGIGVDCIVYFIP